MLASFLPHFDFFLPGFCWFWNTTGHVLSPFPHQNEYIQIWHLHFRENHLSSMGDNIYQGGNYYIDIYYLLYSVYSPQLLLQQPQPPLCVLTWEGMRGSQESPGHKAATPAHVAAGSSCVPRNCVLQQPYPPPHNISTLSPSLLIPFPAMFVVIVLKKYMMLLKRS